MTLHLPYYMYIYIYERHRNSGSVVYMYLASQRLHNNCHLGKNWFSPRMAEIHKIPVLYISWHVDRASGYQFYREQGGSFGFGGCNYCF